MELNSIYTGKMEVVLKDFPDNCVDSIVTDPPYGLKFMGKHWDYAVPTVAQWKEAFRVLKPGGFLLSFGGTRTYHRMVVNIEDAGFEIRDQIQWLYSSGFPKSMDISKALDRQAGAEREVIGKYKPPNGKEWNLKQDGNPDGDHSAGLFTSSGTRTLDVTAPSTEAAKEWDGWGTALKPANEPICVARKPVEGTVADNILAWGTGGMNVDGCRVPFQNKDDQDSAMWGRGTDILGGNFVGAFHGNGKVNIDADPKGRWPANVIMDGFAGEELDRQTGILTTGAKNGVYVGWGKEGIYNPGKEYQQYSTGDSGGASRFFYCPKPDNFERNKGLKDFEKKPGGMVSNYSGQHITRRDGGAPGPRANNHPTVKPIDLMRYLVRLVTPKGGVCLDPFCGSGPTLIGAKMELMYYIGIDDDEANIPLAEARVKAWNPDLYKAQQLFK